MEMARTVQRLTSTKLHKHPPGLHHDGRGLYLQVKNGGRSWVLRYMLQGKARAMGLGPFPDVTLAHARRKAEDSRALLHDGIDPLEARKNKIQADRVSAARSVTFKQCAERYIEAHKSGCLNAKHAAQWGSTIEKYAFPVIRALTVQAIDTGLVMKVLEPIWSTKTETATRLRQRIEAVLDWARAHRYRT